MWSSIQRVLLVLAVLALSAAAAADETDAPDLPETGSPTAAPGVYGSVASGIYSVYLWRARGFTFADAPVLVTEGSLIAQTTAPLAFGGSLRSINAVARRGAPWESATADTVELGAEAATRFFAGSGERLVRGRSLAGPDGWLGLRAGAVVSFHFGALLANGEPSHGMLVVAPFGALALPLIYGNPEWSIVADLTPDQAGFRHGWAWRPAFSLAGNEFNGYVGLFYPRNFLRQDSGSAVGELISGQPLSALGSLIPSDVSLGASTLLALGPSLTFEPEIELALILNRPQNPSQIVLAGAATIHFGAREAITRIHEER